MDDDDAVLVEFHVAHHLAVICAQWSERLRRGGVALTLELADTRLYDFVSRGGKLSKLPRMCCQPVPVFPGKVCCRLRLGFVSVY